MRHRRWAPPFLGSNALLLALSLAPAAAAQEEAPPDENEIQGRGFSPGKLYDFQDIDSVNLFSGNLSLTIPLGPNYPVGGGLSYGFVLTYNSRAWTYRPCLVPLEEHLLEALPTPTANAGLGWMVTFGYLVPPGSPLIDPWTYVSPDGGQHLFWDSLHDEESPEPEVRYTRDGTYLRLHENAGEPDGHVIEFPDGTRQTFREGVHDETLWELTEIRDRFDNTVTVNRDAPDTNHWVVSDSQGRQHEIVFVDDQSPPGDLSRPRIATITLEGFADQSATYTFGYAEPVSIERGCRDLCSGSAPNAAVPLLTSVTLPSGEQYSFGTQASPDYELTCAQGASGALRSAALPTLGKLAWSWSRPFCMPRDREAGGPGGGVAFTCDGGVGTRQLVAPDGSVQGTWQYDNGIYPEEPGGCDTEPGGLCPDATETRTVVVQPTGECHKHYFSAEPEIGPPYTWAYGLPFSQSTQDAGVFLSTEVWRDFEETGLTAVQKLQLDCTDGPARSTWALFAHDTEPPLQFEDGREFHNTNRRLEQSRTLYHDDLVNNAPRFAKTTLSGFDGLGHYRTAVTAGNFAGPTNVRTTFTGFNPDPLQEGTHYPVYPGDFILPDPDDPWLVNLFNRTDVTESGATGSVEFCFDAADGFLKRRRLLKRADGVQDDHDVIGLFFKTPEGNVETEQYFGGDLATVPKDTGWCIATLSDFAYRIDHTYAFGARASSQYLRGAQDPMDFKLYDVDIDASTGLVAASRDSSGEIETLYTYDELGRVTLADVDTGEGADTIYTYDNATFDGTTFTPATVTVDQRDSANTRLALSGFEFDPFGRLSRETRRMPDGSDAQRTIEYDAQGRRERVSEWGTVANPAGDTVFVYDEFGRPTLVTAPDATTTSFVYFGVSRADRTATIGGASVTVREVSDRFGRLRAVEEPKGGNNSFTYTYDEGDRVKEVKSPNATTVQTRTFDYDGRGFLVSETHPELGGTVVYSNYDARGHAGRREQRNAQGTAFQQLDFVYDKAERLLTVTDALAARTLKSFTYDDASGLFPRLDGRLREAVRHNWVDVPWDGTASDVNVIVTETYAYDGVGARVSRRTTTTNRESLNLVTDWTYDELGQVKTTVYPDCVSSVPVNCPMNEPARTVLATYDVGFLTKLGTTSNTGIYATSIGYHPNGMWSTIVRFGSAPDDTQTIEAHGMRRPRQISNAVLSGTAFSTGVFSYDEVGNVTAMGTDTFDYDSRSRLAEATVQGIQQTYTYDFYGNLTSYVTTPGGTTTIATDPATNRLTTAGPPTAQYDAAGNVTVLATTTYRYDPLNMETRRTPPSLPGAEPQWTSVYTADDERFWLFVHNGGPAPGEDASGSSQVLYLRDLSGRLLRQYRKLHTTVPPDTNQDWVWSRDQIWREGTLHAIEKQGFGRQHVHTDHLGSVRQLTSTAGAVLSDHDYLPYGEGAPSSATGVTLQFTGHERELHGTGEIDNLDYLHARYRSPVYARFMSVDPRAQRNALSGPQFWNRYSYTAGNPLKFVDPNGECSVPAGLQEGQVGVCFEAFIATPRVGSGILWLGFGDNRGFEENDPSATARVSYQATIDPGTGSIIGTPNVTAAESRIGLTEGLSIGSPGTGAASVTSTPSATGTQFSIFLSGKNGFSALTQRLGLLGSIGVNIDVTVGRSGAVAGAGSTKGFPHVAGYAYRIIQGELVVEVLFETPAQDPDELQGPIDDPLLGDFPFP